MTERVELWVDHDAITVYWRQFQLARIIITPQRNAEIKTAKAEAVALVEALSLDAVDLDVQLCYTEYPNPDTEGDMALPRRKRVVVPSRPKAKRVSRTVTSTVDPADDGEIMGVRAELLDGMLDNPTATSSERAAESRRIAKRYKLNVYQVAGVRAALTRGAYGDIDSLLRARRRIRRAS